MTILSKKKIMLSAYIVSTSIIFFIFFTAFALLSSGCQNNSSDIINSTPGGDNVSVGFYSENSSGDNTLAITEAKFVIRKLVLDKNDHSHECDVKLGPFVVYLDMASKVTIGGIAKIPIGVYDEVKFQVHKPTPNEDVGDPDFVESNSDRYSVVVKGYYIGNYFVFKSATTVAKEIGLEGQPVAIEAVSPVINLTVRVNPFSWFLNNGVFMDPGVSANRHLIEQNIRQSLRRAFRDINCDGEPD